MTTGMTISQLAQAASVNIETVRYYQRMGLIEEPTKPPAGYRRYAAEQARRLQFIKSAQGLGFTLSEVGSLLRLDTACMCADTRELAALKVKLIDERMVDLAAMRKVLADLIRQCYAGDREGACPIIDVLAAVPARKLEASNGRSTKVGRGKASAR